MNALLHARASSFPTFNLTEQKKREIKSVSVISATGFIPLDKKVQDLVCMRYCSSLSTVEDFPGSKGQQPGSHFYGSSWHEGRHKSISVLLFVRLLQLALSQ